jgi:hypothetical protein
LTQIEQAVGSPHLESIYPEENATPPTAELGAARDEVTKALNESPSDQAQPPIQALGAQQLGPELRPSDLSDDPTTPATNSPQAAAEPESDDPNAPPPVPPPIPFQFGNPPSSQ